MALNSPHAGTIGIALIAFGAIVLAMGSDDVPSKARLTEVSGQLRSLEAVHSKGGGLSAVRFSLTGDSRHFHYLSKAGGIADVWSALEHAGPSKLSVWFDPSDSHSPLLDERTFHTVFEVRGAGGPIRSYADVATSWRHDRRIGAWLGYGTALAGCVLLALVAGRRSGV